jgi:hypothetical protein
MFPKNGYIILELIKQTKITCLYAPMGEKIKKKEQKFFPLFPVISFRPRLSPD